MNDPEPYSLFISHYLSISFSTGFLYAFFIIVLLIISGAVSGSESAFFSLSPVQLEELKKEKSKNSTLLLSLLETPKDLLATILILNNLVNVGIVVLSSFLINSISEFQELHIYSKFLIEIIGITFLILVLGEVAPKILANSNPMKVARIMTRPLYVASKIPPISWLKFVLVNSSIVIHRFKKTEEVDNEELEKALAITLEKEDVEDEQKIFEGIVSFGKTEACQIMTPRVEVESINIHLSFSEVVDFILDAGYSRIPVYKNQPDNVIGILYIKDLLPHLGNNQFKWEKIVRKPFFVPENKKINDLLQDFRRLKMHMSVVVDEYGGASGIVTLEDVLEEIVGDITDEFDEKEVEHTKIDEANYIFEGRTSLKDFCKVIDFDFELIETEKGEAETLGGLVTEKAGRILKNNEFIIIDKLKIIVESSDKKRVKTLKVEINNEDV